MLALGAASTAYADNAYWHGTRNSNWHHGVQGALSNWYAKPPFATENTPLPPPTDGAIFSPRARQHAVVVTRDVAIDEMLFTPGDFYPGAGQYGIGVARLATLKLKGRGLINQSGVPPAILVVDRGSFRLGNQARIRSGNGLRTPIVIRGGDLDLRDRSNGGDATVSNTHNGGRFGLVVLDNRASAGNMIIENAGRALTALFGRSTAGDADLKNSYEFSYPLAAEIDFTHTDGPAGDRKLTAGSIANDFGTVRLGMNQITVLRNFTQGDNGKLEVIVADTLSGRFAGSLRVMGEARIGGTLVVRALRAKIGRYVLFRAAGGRTGAFSKVRYVDFAQTLKARIVDSGTDVILFVERK
jgi:hypothetical protein